MALYTLIVRLFSRLNLACAVLSSAILFFIATIIFVEVVGRALTGTSQLWVVEVSEYSLLYITFLGAPYLLEKNQHVMLDVLYAHLSPSGQRAAALFNGVLGLLVCVALAIVGTQVVIDQIASGVREVTVMRPHSFWLTLSLPLGMALMAFQFLDQCVRAVTGRVEA